MGFGSLYRQLGLEDVQGINRPYAGPSAHAGPNDAEPNADDTGTHDPGTDAHATVPAGPDAVRKLLKLV